MALVVHLGQPVQTVTEPGLHFKMPLIDRVISIDKRILDLEMPAQEIIVSDQKRLVIGGLSIFLLMDRSFVMSFAYFLFPIFSQTTCR